MPGRVAQHHALAYAKVLHDRVESYLNAFMRCVVCVAVVVVVVVEAAVAVEDSAAAAATMANARLRRRALAFPPHVVHGNIAGDVRGSY